jgi:uncharacterized protein DUF547
VTGVPAFHGALRAVRLVARILTAAVGVAVLSAGRPAAQESSAAANQRRTLDQILDIYVRDGLVYYRALKSDSSKLSAYLASAAEAPVDSWSANERLAFWLNAYDAVVLKTVIDHYPVPRRSADYPSGSIRQIPGAFERVQHRIGRRSVTLDDIESKWLADFNDPRVYLAIGRGAVGGGRLRSEAFNPSTVEMQLAEVAAECVARPECILIDRLNNQVLLNAIFSWRSQAFIGAFANAAPAAFASRSPIERAGLALIAPHLLGIEKEFLARNEFKVEFAPFDWSLNDLTGRGGR